MKRTSLPLPRRDLIALLGTTAVSWPVRSRETRLAWRSMVQSAKDRGYGRWSNQRNGDDWTAYDRPMLVCLLGSDRLVREYVGEATC